MTITGTRMVVDPPAGDLDVHGLLAVQDGLATRAQLAAVGMSRSVLRRRVRRGTWPEILPGIYLPAGAAPPTPRQRLLAALLYGGDGTQLTGVEALRLHGFDHLPDDPYVRILVPHARQVRPAGFVCVHRTRRPDPHPTADGPLVVVSVTRAVADAGRCLRWGAPGDVRRLVEQALDRHLTTVGELADEIDHGPRQHSAVLRDAMANTRQSADTADRTVQRDAADESTDPDDCDHSRRWCRAWRYGGGNDGNPAAPA